MMRRLALRPLVGTHATTRAWAPLRRCAEAAHRTATVHAAPSAAAAEQATGAAAGGASASKARLSTAARATTYKVRFLVWWTALHYSVVAALLASMHYGVVPRSSVTDGLKAVGIERVFDIDAAMKQRYVLPLPEWLASSDAAAASAAWWYGTGTAGGPGNVPRRGSPVRAVEIDPVLVTNFVACTACASCVSPLIFAAALRSFWIVCAA